MSEIIEVPSDEVIVPPSFSKTVSHSEAEQFLRCERAHFYSYGMKIQRIRTSDSLSRGLLGHEALQVFFEVQMRAQKAGTWGTEVTADDCQAEALGYVMGKYSEFSATIINCLVWFTQAHQFDNWDILAVEKEFTLHISEDLDYPFIIDLIARDPYGDIWVIDNKFIWDFYTDRDVELMPQLPKYIGGLRALDFPVDKVGYSMLRTRTGLKNEGLDTQYKFMEVEVSDARINNTFWEQLEIARRVARAKAVATNEVDGLDTWSQSALRVTNKMICNSCAFKRLCVEELNNGQVQFVLDSEYMPKTKRDTKVAD